MTMAGKKWWKTIYKEVLKPTELCSDDGNSTIISGTYSREEAYRLIKEDLKGYGLDDPIYYNLKSPKQLQVAMLRRPDPNNGYEEMDANYYAEVINGDIPDQNDVWFYMYDTKKNTT